MRRFRLAALVLCLAVVGFASCAPLGLSRDPQTGEVISDGKGGVVGDVARGLGFGWAVDLVLAGVGVFLAVKGRQWKKAATSTFAAVEEFKATPEGSKVWEALKAKLGEHHATAKITALVEKALGNT